jgi:hypothetical protein
LDSHAPAILALSSSASRWASGAGERNAFLARLLALDLERVAAPPECATIARLSGRHP